MEIALKNNRNLAIDMLRGLTMVLMVFVNELWPVHDVPGFLEHADTWKDGMGLANFVYPLFLFAMGMSIPYAIDRRYEKGFDTRSTLLHILRRTLALILMGVFIYNGEEREIAGSEPLYILLYTVGFFLVWNAYPKDWKPQRWLRAAGIVLLTVLAVTYRTEDGGLFKTGWWGILGQIGWAYLLCSIAYLLARPRVWPLALCWLFFSVTCLLGSEMRDGELPIRGNMLVEMAKALHQGNGHITVMALGGLLTTLCERKLTHAKWGIGLAAAAVLAVLGMLTHQGWIVSKNLGTLPWCLYVSATAVALYTLLRVLEAKGWTAWFKPISVAGTATLTLYMIPYLFEALWIVADPSVPAWVAGWTGVGVVILYTAVCVAIAWLLTRLGLKLKI